MKEFKSSLNVVISQLKGDGSQLYGVALVCENLASLRIGNEGVVLGEGGPPKIVGLRRRAKQGARKGLC